MAIGALVREVELTATAATKGGSLAITAPAAGAKIVGVFVKTCSPEITVRGVTLSNTAATAGTLYYDCAGHANGTYKLTLTVTDYDAD